VRAYPSLRDALIGPGNREQIKVISNPVINHDPFDYSLSYYHTKAYESRVSPCVARHWQSLMHGGEFLPPVPAKRIPRV
jgi:hypothetical protein